MAKKPAGEAVQKIQISIDREIRRLIPNYLGNRSRNIQSIRKAVRTKDFEVIRSLGHSMKGSGATYGFKSISDFGVDLEDAAAQRDIPAILRVVDGLKAYLDNLEIEFK